MSFFNRYFFVGLAAGVGLTVALILVAGLLLMLQVRHQMDDLSDRGGGLSPPPFPQQESLTDVEWKLQSLDGEETSLSAFEGKVLFVNLWATWCGPCVVEMPSIQRLYEQFPQEDMAFLLVSDEPPDVVEEVRPGEGLGTTLVRLGRRKTLRLREPGDPGDLHTRPDGPDRVPPRGERPLGRRIVRPLLERTAGEGGHGRRQHMSGERQGPRVLVTDYAWPTLDPEKEILGRIGASLMVASTGEEDELVEMAPRKPTPS